MAEKSLQDNSNTSNTEKGLDLKAIREVRDLSLSDIYQATRITVISLEAIEAGEFSKLPPPVYAKAYIKTYARFLNVDAAPIISNYEKYMATNSHNHADNHEEVEEYHSFFSKRVTHTFFILLVLCFLGFFIYKQSYFHVADISLDSPFLQKNLPKSIVTTKDSDAIPIVPQASTDVATQALSPKKQTQLETVVQSNTAITSVEENVDKQPKDIAAMPVQKNLTGLDHLIIEAFEETWLRIREDKKQPFQILMKPGEKVERSGHEFIIDVGNAGGISVEFRGRTMSNLGKSGEVIHLRLPDNSH